MHQVKTATRAHRNANPEYHEAHLDEILIQNKKGETETVAGAPIIAVGVGATENTHRLALSGGRHVDVEHGFFAKQQPGVGKFYIQHADGTAEVVDARVLLTEAAAARDAEIAELKAKLAQALPSAADLDAAAADQQAAEATAGDAGPQAG